jgi:PmbA protein
MVNERQLVRYGVQLVELALAAGATGAQASVSFSEGEEVHVRNKCIEKVTRDSGQSVTLYVLVGAHEGTSACESFSKDDLRRTAQEAVAIATASTANPFASLATAEMWPCAMSELPERQRALDLIDPARPLSMLQMKKEALHLEQLLLAEPGVARTETVQVSQSRTTEVRCTSNGFVGVEAATWYSKYASAIAEAANREMNSGGDYHVATHRADLRESEVIARNAGKHARALLGAMPIPTARMPIVFDRDVSTRLLGALLRGIGGTAIYDKSSFLSEKLGEQIFRPGISVIEDPFISRSLRSGLYDNDTVKRSRHQIIQDGVLTMWLTSLESGAKLKIPSTGHAGGVTNAMLSRGTQTPEELIASIPRGLLVTQLMGHGPNMTTGDYSSGAAGLLIENGQIVRPVNEVTIAGNLLEMFRTLIPANDMSDNMGINAPSCLIPEMMVAGR